MAPRQQLAVVAVVLFLAVATATAAPPPAAAVVARGAPASAVPPLPARLHAFSVFLDEGGGGGEIGECWGAVVELGSCTNEIVVFFFSGESSYIGPECCVAIRGATRHCWPAVLASVGFTAEEADVLRGFCDAEDAMARGPPAATPSPPAVGPVPAPAGKQ